MCTLLIACVLHILTLANPCYLCWSIANHTKTSTEEDIWRWSDSLNFLRAEILVEHANSPCLQSRGFVVMTVSRLFNGTTTKRTACVTRSTELGGGGGARTLKTVFCCAFGGSKYSKHRIGWRELSSVSEKRGILTTFVRWLLCNFNHCAKTAKNCRKKQTMVVERSIDGAKKHKWRKAKNFYSLVLLSLSELKEKSWLFYSLVAGWDA